MSESTLIAVEWVCVRVFVYVLNAKFQPTAYRISSRTRALLLMLVSLSSWDFLWKIFAKFKSENEQCYCVYCLSIFHLFMKKSNKICWSTIEKLSRILLHFSIIFQICFHVKFYAFQIQWIIESIVLSSSVFIYFLCAVESVLIHIALWQINGTLLCLMQQKTG